MFTLRQPGIWFIILIIAACNQSPNTPAIPTPDTTKTVDKPAISEDSTQALVSDIILHLPEVQERAGYIKKQTEGKRGLIVWISQTPQQAGSDYYQVNAGEDNGNNLVTHFSFYVHKESFEVKYYDVVNDTAISIADWRKQLNHD